MRRLVSVGLRFGLCVFAASIIFASSESIRAQDAAKKKVTSASDLPRLSYAVSSPPSVMLMADDATFNAFAQKVARDVDSVLREHEIEDQTTLRNLYSAKLNVEMLINDNEAALSTMQTLKDLQEQPEAKAASGLLDRPLIEARIAARASSGEAFEKEFRARLQAGLSAAERRMVENRVKGIKRSLEVATPELLAGSEKAGLDPAAAKTNTVDLAGATTMIEDRTYIKVIYPARAQALPLLREYIAGDNGK
jgi:hypothetical protein